MPMPSTIPTSYASSEIFEPYVSAETAARYLDMKPKSLLEKARKGRIPAYPWGDGMRKTWRFKLSELDEWMKSRVHSNHRPPLSERRGYR
jgi:excisionase family DNA binding protein